MWRFSKIQNVMTVENVFAYVFAFELHGFVLIFYGKSMEVSKNYPDKYFEIMQYCIKVKNLHKMTSYPCIFAFFKITLNCTPKPSILIN